MQKAPNKVLRFNFLSNAISLHVDRNWIFRKALMRMKQTSEKYSPLCWKLETPPETAGFVAWWEIFLKFKFAIWDFECESIIIELIAWMNHLFNDCIFTLMEWKSRAERFVESQHHEIIHRDWMIWVNFHVRWRWKFSHAKKAMQLCQQTSDFYHLSSQFSLKCLLLKISVYQANGSKTFHISVQECLSSSSVCVLTDCVTNMSYSKLVSSLTWDILKLNIWGA